MIEVVSRTSKFTIYKIVNYEKFNQQENQQYQGVEETDDQQTTSRQPADNQQTTNKEESKERKKDKKINYEVFVSCRTSHLLHFLALVSSFT